MHLPFHHDQGCRTFYSNIVFVTFMPGQEKQSRKASQDQARRKSPTEEQKNLFHSPKTCLGSNLDDKTMTREAINCLCSMLDMAPLSYPPLRRTMYVYSARSTSFCDRLAVLLSFWLLL